MYFLLGLVFFMLLISFIFIIKTRIKTSKQPPLAMQLDKTWFPNNNATLTPEKYRRSGDQSFLTYPEWFLVFSPAEQAAYFKKATATSFPYEAHVEQFWESYAALAQEIAPYFPYNKEYHTMIKVIGYSTMVEYRGKLLYEATIGRLTQLIPSKMTAEDRFYGDFTQRYVDFIQKEPWYLYPFLKELKRLWFGTSILEWNLIRKVERRIFISVELLFKALYGWLLGLGTKSAYGVEIPVTAVLVDQLPEGIQERLPELSVLEQLSDEAVLLSLPRYAAFTPSISALVQEGVQIKEIAGNSTSILLSIVVKKDWQVPLNQAKVIFKQTIATDSNKQRLALAVLVPNLAAVMLELEKEEVAIEHIFDY